MNLIVACFIVFPAPDGPTYFTGNVVKEKETTYLVDSAIGKFEVPKELCQIKEKNGHSN